MISPKIEKLSIKSYIGITLIGIIILVVIAASIISNGGPLLQRDKNWDAERINNFQLIETSINNYYVNNKSLPKSLNDVYLEYPTDTKYDPETKEIYVYQIVSSTSYKLCTNFSTEQLDNNYNSVPPYKAITVDSTSAGSTGMYNPTIYIHKKGYDCINFTTYDYSSSPEYSPSVKDQF